MEYIISIISVFVIWQFFKTKSTKKLKYKKINAIKLRLQQMENEIFESPDDIKQLKDLLNKNISDKNDILTDRPSLIFFILRQALESEGISAKTLEQIDVHEVLAECANRINAKLIISDPIELEIATKNEIFTEEKYEHIKKLIKIIENTFNDHDNIDKYCIKINAVKNHLTFDQKAREVIGFSLHHLLLQHGYFFLQYKFPLVKDHIDNQIEEIAFRLIEYKIIMYGKSDDYIPVLNT